MHEKRIRKLDDEEKEQINKDCSGARDKVQKKKVRSILR